MQSGLECFKERVCTHFRKRNWEVRGKEEKKPPESKGTQRRILDTALNIQKIDLPDLAKKQ